MARPPAEGRRPVVAAFAFHAALSGTLGPRFPAIKVATHVSDAGLGTALVGFAAGLFAGTRLAALPLRRFGSRPTLRVGMPLFACTLLGPALANDLFTLTIALAVMGIASGLIDVAMNANAVAVEQRAGRPIMSGIHGVWSAGLLAASAFGAGAAAVDTSPLAHFGAVAVVVAGATLPLLRALAAGPDRLEPVEVTSNRRGVPWSAVLPLGAIGFCSFLGEGAMHDWSAVYLRDRLGTSPGLAALAFTGFAVGMTGSRFAADRLTERFGATAVVRTGGLAAAAGLALGLLVAHPASAIAGFTLLGAALAPVVPLVFSAAGNLGDGARALGWVVTLSYVGGILGPALIGFTADALGLRVALGVVAPLALVVGALARFVAPAGRPAAVGAAPTEWPG